VKIQRLLIEELLLVIWLGSLWTIGLLVAPLLFQLLTPADAGLVAGVLFQIGQAIAAACVAGLLMLCWQQARLRWPLLVLLSLTLANLFIVMPQMSALRSAGVQSAFALWHAVASSLYLVQCLGGLVLLWLRRVTRAS
jgi:hypothetical protein